MKKVVSFFGSHSEIFTILNDRARVYAEQAGIEYKWVLQEKYDRDTVIRELRQADAGIIDIEPYDEEIFSRLEKGAKLLIRFGVGYDQVDLEAASRYGIAIARTTAANTTAVAEMALMLMLTARRRFLNCIKDVEAGKWEKEVGHEVIGSTVGIVGFGVIGQRFAKLLKGFDCRILVYDPYSDKRALEKYSAEPVSLNELFERADAVSIHTPYNKQTHHMINRELLERMKPEAVLINTARGNIVDETALYHILKEERIAGAAFDVFASEPLPKASMLRDLPDMIITPHVSSQTAESLWNIYKTAIDIAAEFFEGKESHHILNPEYKNLT